MILLVKDGEPISQHNTFDEAAISAIRKERMQNGYNKYKEVVSPEDYLIVCRNAIIPNRLSQYEIMDEADYRYMTDQPDWEFNGNVKTTA